MKSAFEEVGIDWTVKEHAVAMTVEEGLAQTSDLNCSFAKNLFFKDKKLGMFLLTVTAERKVDPKKLSGLLGLSSQGNFRFADEKTLTENLAVKQGSVSPLAVMNDTKGAVTLVLDKDLMAAPLIGVHPLRNDMTNTLTPDDLLKVRTLETHGSV